MVGIEVHIGDFVEIVFRASRHLCWLAQECIGMVSSCLFDLVNLGAVTTNHLRRRAFHILCWNTLNWNHAERYW